jgi:hypothetical protein
VSESIAPHTVYKFVGEAGQYLHAVPARDLTGADLVEVEEREGITAEEIECCGLYERVDWYEVPPFCGAPTGAGGRCRRRVEQWGQRCWQHIGGCEDGTTGV